MGVINKSLCILLLLLLTLGISGCNGGGGGGGGGSSSSSASAQAPVYSGNTNAAVITTDNSKTLAANVIGSSGTGLIVAAGIVAEQQPTQSPDLVQLAPRLSNDLRTNLNRVVSNLRSGTQSLAGVSINDTLPCDLSGTVNVSGSLNDVTGTGTLNLTFNSCNDIDGWLNGQATFRIDAYDAVYDFFTDTTISFTALQVKDTNYDVTLGGSQRSQVTILSNRERLSGSFVTRDNASSETAKVDSLTVIVDYNDVRNPSSYNLSMVSGRIFNSVAGYVDIATTAPWFYATLAQDFPSSGGALVLTGANNVHISVTPASSTLVKVELDLDSNGVYELASTMPWTFLAGTPPPPNTAPTANAGANQTVPRGAPVTLDGSGSSDPEYDFLTYQWTLVQKPNGSLAQLSGATTIHPTFTSDLAGNYIVSLVVNDKKLSSVASTVTITAYNTVPVAVAGPTQYIFVGPQVTLDGSNSSDGDGDPLTYSWSFALKPQGSAATLSNANIANPVITPDIAGVYRISLTVNDGAANSQPSTSTVYVATTPASAAQWRVPTDFPTIQVAIDAASPGDTIAVAPGTYVGNLRFNGKAVTLQSSAGPAKTIIEGEGIDNTAVDIGPGGAVIGFTIRKGNAYFGAGMHIQGTGTLIKQNIFESNTQYSGGYGAAIGGGGASPIIDGNIFRNNSCENDYQFSAGVISFINSSPVIKNNLIQNNPCRAINIDYWSTAPQILNNTIVSNRTGIFIYRTGYVPQHIYRNNVVVGNTIGIESDSGTGTSNPVWESNLVFGNGTNYSGMADKTGVAGNISADPMFVDQAGGFYFLKAGSPAIDHGTNTGAPSADFIGRTRPLDGDGVNGAITDIGAFEY